MFLRMLFMLCSSTFIEYLRGRSSRIPAKLVLVKTGKNTGMAAFGQCVEHSPKPFFTLAKAVNRNILLKRWL